MTVATTVTSAATTMTTTTHDSFKNVVPAQKDLIFAVNTAYLYDPVPDKVNLTIGAYRDDDGKPVVFDAVKEAGMRIYQNGDKYNKEYLGMGGLESFCRPAAKLIFGENSPVLKEYRVASVQTLSGTGALSCLGSVLRRVMPMETMVYISDPTWPNHRFIFEELIGFKVATYRYWDQTKIGCNIDNMIADLKAAPKRSIVILHPCAHNPTGEDPTHEEWERIIAALLERDHFAVMDSAYQGFATQDLDRDAWAIRRMCDTGAEFAVCQSFAKNMGLYGERVGALHVVCHSQDSAKLMEEKLKRCCRMMWSNPPRHGAEIATQLLTDASLNAKWKEQLVQVSKRITDMRDALKNELIALGTPGTWDHITKQIGMFSYTGLTPAQVEYITDNHHVYMMRSGRISMAGLNSHNVKYVAQAIDDAVRNA